LRSYITNRLVLPEERPGLEVEDDVGDVLLHPGTVENSCRTPSIRMLVTAAPGIEEKQRTADRVPDV